MALPPYTQLDPGQVIKQSYDESKRSIRVDAQISAPDGSSILIDATTDSIKIGNTATGPFLLVNSDGSINVDGTFTSTDPSIGINGSVAPISSTQVGGVDPVGNLEPLKFDSNGALLVNTSGSFAIQNLRVLFNPVSTIAIGIETNINSYTAPAGKIAYLLSILNSSENRGQFNIYNNGVLFDQQYNNLTNLSILFDYKTGSGSVPGFVVPVGNTILVTNINQGTTTANCSSRFLILEVG